MLRLLAHVTVIALLLVPMAARAADPAIRTVESRHLTLLTDLPADPEVDALAAAFDEAFPQWCAYFGIDPAAQENWRVRACLMRSRERFAAAGLIDASVPEFATGYSTPQAVWLFDQTSADYRRTLLLHEGVHSFMYGILGGTGPDWYAEGIAELLATHRIDDGRLLINQFPRTRDELPQWGRIEAVQQDYANRRAKMLDKIFALQGTLHGTVENYGWCWAAAAFLDNHPRYQKRFRELTAHVKQPDFNDRVAAAFATDRQRLDEDWQVFVSSIDYGYDFERMDFDATPGKPLAGQGATVDVASDRGWQNSGIALAAGQKVRVHASGQYQVAIGQKPWISEPGGVTIRYAHGRPLGMLLAAIRADDPQQNNPSGLIKPIPVGLEATLEAKHPGTLYFRINDSPGELADNEGSAAVEVTVAP